MNYKVILVFLLMSIQVFALKVENKTRAGVGDGVTISVTPFDFVQRITNIAIGEGSKHTFSSDQSGEIIHAPSKNTIANGFFIGCVVKTPAKEWYIDLSIYPLDLLMSNDVVMHVYKNRVDLVRNGQGIKTFRPNDGFETNAIILSKADAMIKNRKDVTPEGSPRKPRGSMPAGAAAGAGAGGSPSLRPMAGGDSPLLAPKRLSVEDDLRTKLSQAQDIIIRLEQEKAIYKKQLEDCQDKLFGSEQEKAACKKQLEDCKKQLFGVGATE